jgi:hypothetical protein
MRDRWRRFSDRQMARRIESDGRPARGPRRAVLLGWLAAAAAIAIFALIVGRPAEGTRDASPTPEPERQSILFGTRLDPATGEAVVPTDRFLAGDPFAYSLRLTQPLEVDAVTVEVLRVEGDSLESSHVGQLPAAGIIAEQIGADAMLATHGPGDFVMRIYVTPDEVLGEGSFTLEADTE